jgi:hypothetical protein
MNDSMREQLAGLRIRPLSGREQDAAIAAPIVESKPEPTIVRDGGRFDAPAAPAPKIPEQSEFVIARQNIYAAAKALQGAIDVLLRLTRNEDTLAISLRDRTATSLYELCVMCPELREPSDFEKLLIPAEYQTGNRVPRLAGQAVRNYDSPPTVSSWGARERQS